MNKQQLIDKAIDEFGEWPSCCVFLPHQRNGWSKKYVVGALSHISSTETVSRKEFEARKAEREAVKNSERDKMTDGIKIVEQARKELGLESAIINKQWQLDAIEQKVGEIKARKPEAHWFDYENQKALRLPPVGEVCLVVSDIAKGEFTFEPCEVVKHIGKKAAFVTPEFIGMFDAPDCFKPLDWSKLRIAAVNELTDIIKAAGIEGVSACGIADDVLAAGYRKCHNKAPSDKE